MDFMLLIHFLGMAAWFGGVVAAMVVKNALEQRDGSRSMIAHLTARIYSVVVGPGALLTAVSGLVLTMQLAQRVGSDVMGQPKLWVMQVTGLVAAVLVVGIAVPTATQLTRVLSAAEGEWPPAAGRLDARLGKVIYVSIIVYVLAMGGAVLF